MKPLLLFTTPGIGSTPVYQLISNYLKRARGVEGLADLFKPKWDPSMIWNHEHEEQLSQALAEVYGKPLSPEGMVAIDLAMKPRWLSILRSPERFFFKIYPLELLPSFDVWISETYEWIFLERRDLFSQLLRFLTKRLTTEDFSSDGMRKLPPRLVAAQEHVDTFETSIWAYLLVKKGMAPARVLFCEDFYQKSPSAFLRQAGLDEKAGFSGLLGMTTQNRIPQADTFRNLLEIKAWYRASMLNRLYPID